MARSPGENALWLKPLRLKHQLTQAEMAKHLDIDPSYYAKVERGQKRPARLTPNKEAPHWLHEARELNKKAPSQTSEAAKLTEEETKPFSDGSGNRLPHLVPANTHPAGNYDWIDPQLPNLQQKFATEFALATDQTATIEQYYREVLERIQLARSTKSLAVNDPAESTFQEPEGALGSFATGTKTGTRGIFKLVQDVQEMKKPRPNRGFTLVGAEGLEPPTLCL